MKGPPLFFKGRMRVVPKQKPGLSRQDYATPWDFIFALAKRFGPMKVDLASSKEHAKCSDYITKEEDSFSVDWIRRIGSKNAFLNPPFSDITPWAKKCAEFGEQSFRGRVFLLVPASVGANWFVDYVHGRAYVLALQGRLTFVGEKDPYPKDCMVCLFGAGVHGFDVWNWTGNKKLQPKRNP